MSSYKTKSQTTVKRSKTIKNEMRSEITYLFWLSYVVFRPVLGKNVGVTATFSSIL